MICDRHFEQAYYGKEDLECWCCQFERWLYGQPIDPRWTVPDSTDWMRGTEYDTVANRERIRNHASAQRP